MSLTTLNDFTTPDSAFRPLSGAELVLGDRVLVTNPVTSEKHWTGPITSFTEPKLPQRADNARTLPQSGDRVAWTRNTCLGPIPAGGTFLVRRVADEDAWLYGGDE